MSTTEHTDISLFTHPLKTTYIFGIIVLNFLKNSLFFILNKWYIVLLLAAIIVGPRYVEGEHLKTVTLVDEIAIFVGWWIILGVASSIGLGTGLHTFVLYLGPHIAKVTMVANECNAIPRYLPSRWNFKTFDDCPKNVTHPITFWEILLSVQLEAFLWGLGTAIGELPPYFISRAHALSKQKNEELDEMLADTTGFMGKAKIFIYQGLKKHAFITVLLCASIPNPLFDLAGITCGHFLIPFTIFFTATAIGKAIIKTHIQMIFVIFCFNANHVEHLLKIVEQNIPQLSGSLINMLEKQKHLLHYPQNFQEGNKPIVAQAWDVFIGLMIGYFLISIVNSQVNDYLRAQYEESAQDNKSNKVQQKQKNENQSKQGNTKTKKQN